MTVSYRVAHFKLCFLHPFSFLFGEFQPYYFKQNWWPGSLEFIFILVELGGTCALSVMSRR